MSYQHTEVFVYPLGSPTNKTLLNLLGDDFTDRVFEDLKFHGEPQKKVVSLTLEQYQAFHASIDDLSLQFVSYVRHAPGGPLYRHHVAEPAKKKRVTFSKMSLEAIKNRKLAIARGSTLQRRIDVQRPIQGH